MQSTRYSLLLQLCGDSSNVAWQEFLALYYPLISRTIRKMGISPSDEDDAIQEVLMQLVQAFPLFTYQKQRGYFRNWLRHVTTNKAIDIHRRQGSSRARVCSFDEPAWRDDSDVWTREFRIGLLQSAMSSIEGEFRPKTWQCFVLHALQRRSASQTSAVVGVSENAVYINTNRVMARLREFCEFHGEELSSDQYPYEVR